MSHAYGEVWSAAEQPELLGHFEYNGTCDTANRDIRKSREEVQSHWREDWFSFPPCSCGNPPVDVVLWTSYGYGFHWPAVACLTCSVIVDGHQSSFSGRGKFSGDLASLEVMKSSRKYLGDGDW